MTNEKGSGAIALVLIVLGVISLIGAAAILHSKYDLRFATAYQLHGKMFNLADGSSAMATKHLDTVEQDPHPTVTGGVVQSATTSVYKSSSPDLDSTLDARLDARHAYAYEAVITFYNYDTSAEASAGWEIGEYYVQHWGGRGFGKRQTTFTVGTLSVVNVASVAYSKK